MNLQHNTKVLARLLPLRIEVEIYNYGKECLGLEVRTTSSARRTCP